MKPTIPMEILSTQEFGQLHNSRLMQQQLAQSAFYHLYLKFEHNDTVMARSVVSTNAQFEVLDDLVGNTTSIRLNFLDTDLHRIGFEFETWADMLDGDIFLEKAIMSDDPAKGKLRQGVLLPYDDGVNKLVYAGKSITDLVRDVMKKPKHRRDNSEYGNV